ncbi:ABATE domain-containing protein [Amycolatopsis sp. GM8]|uniref:CGNR zinc finger domain-containing protein n=1 Tax=Amycolatopsis sp. GM8 TaxID=2896530 RepID=UPI001F33C4CC|nr:ABATE domain-containing protein [Amycolatopsis sp. GM8]
MPARGTSIDPPPAFVFVGGRPCLDLVDTVAKRGSHDIERLPDGERLGRWLVEAGLATSPPQATGADVRRARELREAVYGLVRCVLDRRRPSEHDAAVVNRLAHDADLVPRLQIGAGGLTAAWHGPAPVAAALSTIARDAIDLLSGPLAGRVKECANPECTLVFLDDSQARRRRWCAMERCGNLAKIGRYRGRAAGETS